MDLAQKTEVNFSGVDTSNGVPRQDQGDPDYHSIVVLNDRGIQTYAFHSNKMPLKEFAGQTIRGDENKMYHVAGIPTKIHATYPGIMCIERWATGDIVLSRHEAPNDNNSEVHGFRTTNQSKMRLLNDLRLAVNSEAITITDAFTYQCMTAFEDQSTGITERAGAAKGCYDDPVMALAMAWREFRRWSGFQYDFTAYETNEGQRMIGMTSSEDLSASELDKVLSVGQTIFGPMTDAGKSPVPQAQGTRSQLDEFDLVRSGQVRKRHTEMRPTRMRD